MIISLVSDIRLSFYYSYFVFKIFPEWKSVVVIQEKPPQVGVVVEFYPQQVVDLSFVVFGSLPDITDGIDFGIHTIGGIYLQYHHVAVFHRFEVVNDLHGFRVVYPGEANQVIK
jgi:hypothetical protein